MLALIKKNNDLNNNSAGLHYDRRVRLVCFCYLTNISEPRHSFEQLGEYISGVIGHAKQSFSMLKCSQGLGLHRASPFPGTLFVRPVYYRYQARSLRAGRLCNSL